jgi:hypothetical protein
MAWDGPAAHHSNAMDACLRRHEPGLLVEHCLAAPERGVQDPGATTTCLLVPAPLRPQTVASSDHVTGTANLLY